MSDNNDEELNLLTLAALVVLACAAAVGLAYIIVGLAWIVLGVIF